MSGATSTTLNCAHHWHERGSILDYPVKRQLRVVKVDSRCDEARIYIVAVTDITIDCEGCCHCRTTRYWIRTDTWWRQYRQGGDKPPVSKGTRFFEGEAPKGLKAVSPACEHFGLRDSIKRWVATTYSTRIVADLASIPMELRGKTFEREYSTSV